MSEPSDADPPPLNALYFQLFNEIGIIAQLSRTILEAHLAAGMVLPHFSVLNHLIRVRDGQTPLALARAFQTPKTSLTHTLQGLESRGYVDMRPNPEDGRSKCVFITPAGRRERDRVIQSMGGDLAGLAAQFAPETAAGLLPALIDLRRILDAARD